MSLAKGARGPSPRAWGSQGHHHGARPGLRSIPTCVGLTGGRGRPPRGRRSIPTCVGLTPGVTGWWSWRTVHPHVRGAHCHPPSPASSWRGPSPRAWGSQRHHGVSAGRGRSIPTCLGLTLTRSTPGKSGTVHPHVRGAHRSNISARSSNGGPSPRAWGSPDDKLSAYLAERSIPTCVGLTWACWWAWCGRPVHPHVRGAHDEYEKEYICLTGPSPRAWGSRYGKQEGPVSQRSIPTCVGLTRSGSGSSDRSSVHPHVRGAHIHGGRT